MVIWNPCFQIQLNYNQFYSTKLISIQLKCNENINLEKIMDNVLEGLDFNLSFHPISSIKKWYFMDIQSLNMDEI
jgi:hypothetical protein